MKDSFTAKIITISVLFSIILTTIVYFIYRQNISVLSNNISNEYLTVYINTHKDHIQDLLNHVYNDINAEREYLKINILNKLSNYIKITENIVKSSKNNNEDRKILTVLNNVNKSLYGTHIRIFVIDKQTKTFIVKPYQDISEKALLNGKNSMFISKYTTYKPKKWIIGAVADYKKFENDLKEHVLDRLYHFRYGLKNEGYFFVVSIDKKNNKIITKRLLNPNKPKSSMCKIIPLDIKDVKGKQFHREMVEKCLTVGQGFEEYYFKIIGTNEIAKKISFVRFYKPWHWMIGTGFYVTIFKNQLISKNKILQTMISKRNHWFLFSLILSFGFIIFVFVYVLLFFLNRIKHYIKKIEEDDKFKQKLIEMIPNPMFFTDEQGNIVDCNEDFKEFFDLEKTGGCGSSEYKSLENLENKLKAILVHFKKEQKEESIEIDLEIENNKKIFELYISHLEYENELSGYICIIIDITEQKKSQEKLYNQAIKDELTKAFNRRYLKKLFPIERRKARDKNYKISLIMFDIDFFKKVNDTYGHDVGDEVLKKVVEIAEKHIRKEDFLFRTGGEEFIIMLTGADKNKAYHIAEEIRKDVKSYIFEQGFNVTMSFGVVEIKQEDDLESSLKKTDKALYKSKNTGRDKTTVDEEL